MSDKSKICAIGEKKLIGGKWYEKAAAEIGCRGCAWKRESYAPTACNHPEVGGTDCHSSIWIACDPPQPETPAVEECAGCRYWKKDAVTNDGVCRRYPIDQPRKYRTDWCGEWKA